MLRRMCSVSQRDNLPNVELEKRKGIEMFVEVVKRNWLRRMGHALWKEDGDWVKRSTLYKVDGVRGRKRQYLTWNQVVAKDVRECGLNKVDA